MPHADPSAEAGGFAARLALFAQDLRAEGVSAGTAELVDAFAALDQVTWTNPEDLREALACTLAKSADDRRRFDQVFDRFLFRASEASALAQGATDERSLGGDRAGGEQPTFDEADLRQRIAEAITANDESAMTDLARLAISAFARRGQGSGVIGVDVQRIRRSLGLQTDATPEQTPTDPGQPPPERLSRVAMRRFEAILRRELERGAIARSGQLPPSRPLADLQRGLPGNPLQDLSNVHRVVAQLKRRLKTQGSEARGHRRHAHVDIRKTMRVSLQTGGVPVELRYRPVRPRRPEIIVVCDVSTSVTSASVFFLSVMHAMHDAFRKMRSFVFIERISEVTEIFERERDFRKVNEAISRGAGVADISGYTDYGRVWSELRDALEEELHPRASVIVLGDARTNGRDPRADLFADIAARAGRTIWLNPEPRLYWNYGDSVISQYATYCETFECSTTEQLEVFVKALTSKAPLRS